MEKRKGYTMHQNYMVMPGSAVHETVMELTSVHSERFMETGDNLLMNKML